MFVFGGVDSESSLSDDSYESGDFMNFPLYVASATPLEACSIKINNRSKIFHKISCDYNDQALFFIYYYSYFTNVKKEREISFSVAVLFWSKRDTIDVFRRRRRRIRILWVYSVQFTVNDTKEGGNLFLSYSIACYFLFVLSFHTLRQTVTDVI